MGVISFMWCDCAPYK